MGILWVAVNAALSLQDGTGVETLHAMQDTNTPKQPEFRSHVQLMDAPEPLRAKMLVSNMNVSIILSCTATLVVMAHAAGLCLVWTRRGMCFRHRYRDSHSLSI